MCCVTQGYIIITQLIFVENTGKPRNGDMEIIAILGKQLLNFLEFRVEISFVREIPEISGRKMDEIKEFIISRLLSTRNYG